MIIADTGFWLALANRRDRHHKVAAESTLPSRMERADYLGFAR